MNPFNAIQRQPSFGAQKLQGAALQRQSQDAGNAGASSQVAAMFAGKLQGSQAAQSQQALQGVQGSQNQPNNTVQQFGLNNPRPAEGVGNRLLLQA